MPDTHTHAYDTIRYNKCTRLLQSGLTMSLHKAFFALINSCICSKNLCVNNEDDVSRISNRAHRCDAIVAGRRAISSILW